MGHKKDEKIFIANTAEEVKMIFEPYRLKILKVIHKSEKEMTVKQIATQLEQAPNKVHYHVKKLHDFGVLDLVRTENINGIIAKFYKTTYNGYMIGSEGKSQEVLSAKEEAIMNALDDSVKSFKEDMVTYINMVAEKGKEAQRGLIIGYEKLYMTKEEKEDFIEELDKLYKKYHKEDQSKEIYTAIRTMARIK